MLELAVCLALRPAPKRRGRANSRTTVSFPRGALRNYGGVWRAACADVIRLQADGPRWRPFVSPLALSTFGLQVRSFLFQRADLVFDEILEFVIIVIELTHNCRFFTIILKPLTVLRHCPRKGRTAMPEKSFVESTPLLLFLCKHLRCLSLVACQLHLQE